jgi:AcrR family transcriptional regulator
VRWLIRQPLSPRTIVSSYVTLPAFPSVEMPMPFDNACTSPADSVTTTLVTWWATGFAAPRASAVSRNAELLLAAARALLEESASLEEVAMDEVAMDEVAMDEVAMDEVARRAGVGNATLYRHFPTRGDLLVAVYAGEVATLRRQGADLLTAPSPLDALFTWLDAFVVHIATKRTLALAATEGPAGRRTQLFDEWHASMHSTAAALIAPRRGHAARWAHSHRPACPDQRHGPDRDRRHPRPPPHRPAQVRRRTLAT